MVFKLKRNPFTNLPLDNPRIFAGREKEIFYMVNSLYQTQFGKPKHVFVSGERGIGKSSYVKQIELIANGDTTLMDKIGIESADVDFRFLVGKHICLETNTLEEIVDSIIQNLKNKLLMLPSFKDKAFNIDVEFNFGIVKTILKAESEAEHISPDIINKFSNLLKRISDKTSHSHSGILIIIDELDRVVDKINFGSFFKALTEKLIDDGANNVSIILVGINGAMGTMENQHSSIRRAFHEIEIPLLEDDKRKDIVVSALNEVDTTVDNDVLDEVSKISDGFPAPIHVVGESMFDEDTDSHIDIKDFESGLSNVVKYIKKAELNDKLKGAGWGRTPQILKIMATYEGDVVPISYINEKLGVDHPKHYSTNLSNLLKSDLIIKIDRGLYKIKDQLLKTYIKNVAVLEEVEEEESDE
ncbi:Cdc6-like AAA superfamily ATPase [Bacillus sp. SORGH_AS 510]|uniref:AAA family ATPase n=1 Tax=Bacillus sp. SORGH_AS_0510 TaxID=3041771 RepID=UPI002789010C|nr:ATP-binding protein [Bacillus sp. SORGH_AS_0510]MDQ1143428.1 Cdc6-like AAA superfamily ATPase [Bacillus sp. SORGH_AS_0510]